MLIIYAAFFGVHFFCNPGVEKNLTVSGSISYQVKDGKQKSLHTGNANQKKKSSIRLNKRFQPAIVPDIVYSSVQLPVKFIDNTRSEKPKSYLLISFILAASLRGPPQLS
ncbi:MAG: hypothetical protein ABUT20_19755 [Bacteroidota bacterium]